MAVVSLNDTQSRTQYLRNVARLNLRYCQMWLDTIEDRTVAAFDDERDNIVKAIVRAFKLGQLAWPEICQLVITASPYMERRGQWGVWNPVLSQALGLTEHVGDDSKTATLSALLARLFYKQSRFRESIAYYRQTIRLARKTDNRFEEARACTNLGFFFVEREQWHRAEILCCYALTTFRQISSQHGIAHTCNHLGFLYTRQEDYAQAQCYLAQACTIWQVTEDAYGLMAGSINLSTLYMYKGLFEEALTYAKNALEFAKQTGEEKELGTIYTNMGMAYLQLGRLAEARQHSLKAEVICQRFFYKRGLAEVQENLGKIYLELKDYETASQYLATALNAWRTLGNKRGEIQTKLYLTDEALAKGNIKQATAWFVQADTLLNSQAEAIGYQRLRSQRDERRRRLDPVLRV